MKASAEVGHLVPLLIKAAFPRHSVKLMAAAADVPLETSRNWLRRRSIPSAASLLKAATRCERFAHALGRLARDLEARRAQPCAACAQASRDGEEA
jgi:hypothetical protein